MRIVTVYLSIQCVVAAAQIDMIVLTHLKTHYEGGSFFHISKQAKWIQRQTIDLGQN